MKIEDLNQLELARLARFLMERVDMNTRSELMAELPIIYAVIHPSSKSEVMNQVREALERV